MSYKLTPAGDKEFFAKIVEQKENIRYALVKSIRDVDKVFTNDYCRKHYGKDRYSLLWEDREYSHRTPKGLSSDVFSNKRLSDLLLLRTWEPLRMTFGKYSGLLLDYVISEDPGYCQWILNNIQGDTFEKLRMYNYVGLALAKKKYFFNGLEEMFDDMLDELVPKDILQRVDKKEAIRSMNVHLERVHSSKKEVKRTESYNSDYLFDHGYYDSWDTEAFCSLVPNMD